MKGLVLTIWAVMALVLMPTSDPAAIPGEPLSPTQDVWRSGDTTLRPTGTGPEAKELFAAARQEARIQGVWRSGDTTLRLTVTGSEVKGLFAAVGPEARTLGFKPGDVSFVATVRGNYLYGQQTIRYGGSCHANGRKVPLIGRLTPNGQVLALHFYNVEVDPNCQDTGQVSTTETLWQRQPER